MINILDHKEKYDNDKDIIKIIDCLSKFDDMTLEVDVKERETSYNHFVKEISIGIGYLNGVNNKREIIILKNKNGYGTIQFQHWIPFLSFGRTMHRVTFPFHKETDLSSCLPKNLKQFDAIIDEFKYESEFEQRTFKELNNILL